MGRFVVCMVGLLMILAVVPVVGSGGQDPFYSTAPYAFSPGPASMDTCHSDTSCVSGSSDLTSFHNDETSVISIWAVNSATGDVDYWQCIDPGLYSGTGSPMQGSTSGDWPSQTGGGTYLGDLNHQGQTYSYEWYDGCFEPCTGILPGVANPLCILLTPFKEDFP